MKLDNPYKALLWRCWRLSWQQLLIAQLAFYAIVIPILLFLDLSDSASMGGFINSSLTLYLMLVWGLTLKVTLNTPNSWNAAGYQNTYDLRQPVAVTALVLIPFAYLVAIFLFSYTVPAILLQWAFGYSGPSLLVCLLIAETLIIITAATWWSSDPWDSGLAWFVFFGLFSGGWLFPFFIESTLDGSAARTEIAISAFSLFHYALIIVGAIGITVLGVARQRVGENLLGLGRLKFFNPTSGFLQFVSLSFLKGPCPTESGWRAELWRLQRFRGPSNYALYGLIAALFPCLLIASIGYFNPERELLPLGALLGMSTGAFFILVLTSTTSIYGMRTINQKFQFGLFEKIRPLATSRAVSLTLLTLFTGLFVAALSMVFWIHLLGPIFIENFADLRQEFYSVIVDWVQQPPGQWLPTLLLVPVYVMVLMILFASLISWSTLQPKKTTAVLLGITTYALFLLLLIVGLNLDETMNLTVRDVLEIHLWVLLAVSAAALIYSIREILGDKVLNLIQAGTILAVGIALLLLFVSVIDINELTAIRLSPGLTNALIISVGLLPLFAAAIMLFTQNRIRHG